MNTGYKLLYVLYNTNSDLASDRRCWTGLAGSQRLLQQRLHSCLRIADQSVSSRKPNALTLPTCTDNAPETAHRKLTQVRFKSGIHWDSSAGVFDGQ